MFRKPKDVPLLPAPEEAPAPAKARAGDARGALVRELVSEYGYTFSPWLRFWYSIKM